MTPDTSLPWPPLSPVLVDLGAGLATTGPGGVTGGFAVYRFVPYGAAVRQGLPSPVVPWAADWPPYLAATIAHYVPLPLATSESPAIARDLGFQERDDQKLPVQQAVYRGWPLYLFDLDVPGGPARGRVPGFFEVVTPDVPPLADGDDELPTWPNTFGGP
ncbi:hypothetical protein [Deinococcus sp. Leaf326]|uniref:hypothetical protein n=1 Tax=Deinococcus sp. Leaf326 TaxID=1736338 RepID=UPI0006F80AE6|nr:hypothetical protein [Deinococcus sp. Leaf326]KQR01029.1 hypothetical protein ASF71_12775 [Deinococcus sp. Leaf326]